MALLTLVQISDTHLYADPSRLLHGVNTNQSLKAVVGAILNKSYSLDGVVVTGDLVHDESIQGYQWLIQIMAEFDLPCYVIPGNHDAPGVMKHCLVDDGPVAWVDWFCLKGWQFLFLNSHVQGEVGGALDNATYDELVLRLSRCYMPTVIFIHHPPLPIGSAWLDRIALQDADRFLSVIDTFPHIKAVINGHIHQAFEFMSKNGVFFYGAPSTCAQFKPQSGLFTIDDAPPGWRLLRFFANGNIESIVERV